MNFHFTTTRRISRFGRKVIELLTDEGLKVESDIAFNDMVEKLKAQFKRLAKKILLIK